MSQTLIDPAKVQTVENLKDFVNNRMNQKAIYQPLVIKTLVNEKTLSIFKKQMCEILQKETKESKSFSDCPVFRVLKKHGIINYDEKTKVISLNIGELKQEEIQEISNICDKKINNFKGGSLI